jgi:hypothetical protein
LNTGEIASTQNFGKISNNNPSEHLAKKPQITAEIFEYRRDSQNTKFWQNNNRSEHLAKTPQISVECLEFHCQAYPQVSSFISSIHRTFLARIADSCDATKFGPIADFWSQNITFRFQKQWSRPESNVVEMANYAVE